jgi:hypothetical protein
MSQLKKMDTTYSKWLGIFNPYSTFPYKLSKSIPQFDIQAYKLNPHHQRVYDKLFIVQSQYLPSGELEDLRGQTDIPYPIFIKPRWGHKTASSKDCYKIKSYEDLEPHFRKKDMMWSTFLNAKEGMTDFVLVNGEIVYQLTYVYSEKQYGFADVWKHVSTDNVPPSDVVQWVNKHMAGYTGPLNVQYRDTIIIEVGMRFARSGMYIESTENKPLIDAINHMWETKTWMVREEIRIQPFYSFKCWSPIPVLCLLPQHVLDVLMNRFGAMNFYEYYFEPTGTHSTVFFQFLHKDFETGMRLKQMIESLLLGLNALYITMALLAIGGYLTHRRYKPFLVVWIALTILSMDNSLNIIYSQVSHQKQFLF